AHSVAAILAMQGASGRYEFQRLHGMGEALHEAIRKQHDVTCRIYAPVGAHEDLLAYLVRRLLENGANSSFVNQIVDEDISPAEIARDPISELHDQTAVDPLGQPKSIAQLDITPHPGIRQPLDVFAPERRNSVGHDVNEPASIKSLEHARRRWAHHAWSAAPGHAALGASATASPATQATVHNPARPTESVGIVTNATDDEVQDTIASAVAAVPVWSETPPSHRAAKLRIAASLYEASLAEFCALATREAGKTLLDGIAEVREAVDFLRYYAAEIERLSASDPRPARGVIVCISPWNFPLAIFTGQVAAALAAGNAVIAKPAEETPLIAARAVSLLHEAGVPRDVLQILPGTGETVGAALTADPRIAGVCFTGSTEVAQLINRSLAEHAPADAMLIAETGGLNAMIVDSTALPEQAVRDIVVSAFQSAGQRCSALRMLYVQEDVAEKLKTMLFGAMDELRIGDPWLPETDIGPVIGEDAADDIQAYCDRAAADGRLLKQSPRPPETDGHFIGPAVVSVKGIADIPREVFGPVLHIATFKASEIDAIVADINARGYGLTFGLHTRIDDRVDQIVSRIACGNTYVNRNQIGAIVGSQPFGGEGLSGTGPKAGGPNYLPRFLKGASYVTANADHAVVADVDVDAWPSDALVAELRADLALVGAGAHAARLDQLVEASRRVLSLPGPTGETNRLSYRPRGCICLISTRDDEQIAATAQAVALGNSVRLAQPPGDVSLRMLARWQAAGADISWADATLSVADVAEQSPLSLVAILDLDDASAPAYGKALAARDGAIVPLILGAPRLIDLVHERHLCVDTTAAGGNAALLASADMS
ncbi:MAG: bifunctional proline dehydrogenase/L-glutamate gamma-semialdehyde dehydrogenase PutA, partial [Pseudomonadota bacterium]